VINSGLLEYQAAVGWANDKLTEFQCPFCRTWLADSYHVEIEAIAAQIGFEFVYIGAAFCNGCTVR